MLTSIARYNEMNYIFDILMEHNQFELLYREEINKVTNLERVINSVCLTIVYYLQYSITFCETIL